MENLHTNNRKWSRDMVNDYRLNILKKGYGTMTAKPKFFTHVAESFVLNV